VGRILELMLSWHGIRFCIPKKEGGLGIKKLDIWNQACMLHHIWTLFARSGSLWVAWVEKNLLKGDSFWQVSIPQSGSWSWKKLLKLINVAKQFLSFKVGDGNKIFLWYDTWHPEGCLFDKFEYRVIYDAGRNIGPRVSSIIRDGEWFWPSARSDHLVLIQSRLHEIPIGGVDLPIWKSSSGKYSSAQTWELLRNKLPEVSWHQFVWFSWAIPKHAFFLWLVFRNALVTKERMCYWGYSGSTLCLFCFACQESREHLFFSCNFSRRICRRVMKDCLIRDPPIEWDSLVNWCNSHLRGRSLIAIICKLCFGASVYHLWRHRNALLHGNTLSSEDTIVLQVKRDVRLRLLAHCSNKMLCRYPHLVKIWRLQQVLSGY
jgi:hypothetical protein